jgi:hypothetical protein
MFSTDAAVRAIHSAINRGAPLYNVGDIGGCAALYLETAKALCASGSLTELSAVELSELAESPPADANMRAWALRDAFDRFLGDLSYAPLVEAKLPRGFPGPGRPGRVEEKSYPAYRGAVAPAGGAAFGMLFRHITERGVSMTAPVVSRLGDGGAPATMAFCYENPAQGGAGAAGGGVAVVDAPPMRVLSVGVRGSASGGGEPPLALAKRTLMARLALGDLESTGEWRTLGWNSPMVPPEQRLWDLQVGLRGS